MSVALTGHDVWSATPILDAVERYRGRMIDLDSGRTIEPREFAAAREGLARRLRANGLRPGDRVVMAVGNGPLFVATLTAILACEGSPLLVHVMTPAAELARHAERFGARFLAAHPRDDAALDARLATSTNLPLSDIDTLRWATFHTSPSVRGPELRGVPMHPTSGSTGLPKIALRPGFCAIEEARHYANTAAIDEDDCIFAIPPMSHAYGYGMCVMVPLLTGASIVSTSSFNIANLSSVLAAQPVTVLPCVPAHVDMLLFGGLSNFGRLRWMLAAGSTLPRRAATLFRQKTGVTVCPLYGTTETGGITIATAADGRDVDGRVGAAMEGVEACVRPSRDGASRDENWDETIGKLHIRSSSMMAGYLDDSCEITSPLVDGWFETGDMARLVDGGVIHLRGRTGEMINVLGLKVVPAEVEEAIATMRGVREVKVYGGRLNSQSEIVKAAVAVDDNIDVAAVRAHCEAHLVYYKQPQVITIVEALPRSPAGKIVRDRLP